jgi:hypothetical protein
MSPWLLAWHKIELSAEVLPKELTNWALFRMDGWLDKLVGFSIRPEEVLEIDLVLEDLLEDLLVCLLVNREDIGADLLLPIARLCRHQPGY